MNENKEFTWACQGEAEILLEDILNDLLSRNSFAKKLEEDLEEHTSTRLFDWIDHVCAPWSEALQGKAEACGFVEEDQKEGYYLFWHPRAQLPRLVMQKDSKKAAGLAVKVESIADFLMAQQKSAEIKGGLYGQFRSCNVHEENGVALFAVERRGTRSMEPTPTDAAYVERYCKAFETFRARPRHFESDEEGMEFTLNLVKKVANDLGKHLAAWVFFEAERAYWMARNTAARLQFSRQERLGMGWANHDHHTYRGSRHNIGKLLQVMEALGFYCREAFYAGAEAGWGAQVMENSHAGIVLFLDLDLEAEELEIDFVRESLPERPKLGTVGLWCALHGDSILEAGLHHLEGQFMFEKLRTDLDQMGVGMMDPFSNFPYLKQAFTAGEWWEVQDKKIDKLLAEGKIQEEDAKRFREKGAVGSHLENLQRRQGFKGFNQKNVSWIIGKTDPRALASKGA